MRHTIKLEITAVDAHTLPVTSPRRHRKVFVTHNCRHIQLTHHAKHAHALKRHSAQLIYTNSVLLLCEDTPAQHPNTYEAPHRTIHILARIYIICAAHYSSGVSYHNERMIGLKMDYSIDELVK